MKYVIKNCENYDPFLQEPTCNKYPCDCQTKTDCLLKKIVEKCREAQEIMDKEQYYEDDFDTFNGESIMAERVMDILDIEECE